MLFKFDLCLRCQYFEVVNGGTPSNTIYAMKCCVQEIHKIIGVKDVSLNANKIFENFLPPENCPFILEHVVTP